MEMMMLRKLLAILVMLPMSTSVVAQETPKPLFDFQGANATEQWQTVNDGVMGGVSDGKFTITDAKTMKFYGTLSLENNGGFASVRSRGKSLGLEKGDTIVAKVKGDGREYSLNLYLSRPQFAYSYRAPLKTKKGEWIEAKIPIDDMVATFFGRTMKEAGPVNPKEVNAIGFLLGDKKPGPFEMEIEWIKVERAGK